MKKTNFVVLGMAIVLSILQSCKKADIGIENHGPKLESVEYFINNERLVFTAYVDESGKPTWIENETNRKVLDYFKSHPESVTHIDVDGGTTKVYPDLGSYGDRLFAPLKWDASKCKGNAASTGTAAVTFYKHTNLSTPLVTSTPNSNGPFANYPDYLGSTVGSIFASDVTHQVVDGVPSTQGFKVPWVGSANNDNFSSLRINPVGDTYFSGGRKFNTVMFQHADFKGRAIAITTCVDQKVNNLKQFRMIWYFTSWNDQISSYYGYYF